MSLGYLWVFMCVYNGESGRWEDAIEGVVRKFHQKKVSSWFVEGRMS